MTGILDLLVGILLFMVSGKINGMEAQHDWESRTTGKETFFVRRPSDNYQPDVVSQLQRGNGLAVTKVGHLSGLTFAIGCNVNRDGDYVVCDTGTNSVKIFDSNTLQPILTLGKSAGLCRPSAVIVSNDSRRVFCQGRFLCVCLWHQWQQSGPKQKTTRCKTVWIVGSWRVIWPRWTQLMALSCILTNFRSSKWRRNSSHCTHILHQTAKYALWTCLTIACLCQILVWVRFMWVILMANRWGASVNVEHLTEKCANRPVYQQMVTVIFILETAKMIECR